MKTYLAALLVALTVVLGGCGRRDARSDDAPFDVETMAFLSEARALHHQAGIREESGDLPGAIATLTRLTSAQRPHPDRAVPEVEEVLADALARRAELELRAGRVDDALASTREGLKHAEGPTFFRGHLLEVEGLIEKARAASLADAGRTDEASAARARALDLLEQAVKIQERVIATSLREGGAP